MVVANFSFIAFEYGTHDFEVLFEQIVNPRGGGVSVPLIVDYIEPDMVPGGDG